mmetsp:Transcript_1625/g.3376  ORF Transcript_1625/g.3376 Transcript_1625/m.3376 type:complete len:99 (+) Transcript_1625:274-570(+)
MGHNPPFRAPPCHWRTSGCLWVLNCPKRPETSITPQSSACIKEIACQYQGEGRYHPPPMLRQRSVETNLPKSMSSAGWTLLGSATPDESFEQQRPANS